MNQSSGWFAGVEARNYLVEKNVMGVIEEGLAVLLQERPKDPVAKLAEVLRDRNPTRKTTDIIVDGVPLRSICPSIVLRNTPLQTVPNWRRSGQMNIWAMSSVGFDGWKRVIDYIKTTQKGITKIITIETNSEQVTYIRGTPHIVTNPEDISKLSSPNVSTLQHVVREAARSRDSRKIDFDVLKIGMPQTFMSPDTSKYTQIQDMIFKYRKGIIEEENTAIIIHSITGKDDASIGLMIVSSVVHAIQKVRTQSRKKAEWKEKLRDRVVKKREAAALVAMKYQLLITKDKEQVELAEKEAKSKVIEETQSEYEERLQSAQTISDHRTAQWLRYNELIRSTASTKISSAFRGYSGRKLAATKKKNPQLLDAPRRVDSGLYATVRGVQSKDQQTTNYSIIKHTIESLLSIYGSWELLTSRQQPRNRLVVEREMIVVNDGEIENPECDIFKVTTYHDTDDERNDDFAIPMSSFINVVRSCSHLRSYISDSQSMSMRFGTVGAVQARILKAFDFMSVGIAFYTHTVLRTVSDSRDLIKLFGCPDKIPLMNQKFTYWLSDQPNITEALREQHLFCLSEGIKNNNHGIMKDRILLHHPSIRQKRSSPSQRRKSRLSLDNSIMGLPDRMRRSQVGMSQTWGDFDHHRAFKRVHKKLNLFSIIDPAAGNDFIDVMNHLSESSSKVLWLSLGMSPTVAVGEEVYSARLRVPTLCPSNGTMEPVKDCVTKDSLTPEIKHQTHNGTSSKMNKLSHIDPVDANVDTDSETPFEGDFEIPVFGLLWSDLESRLIKEISTLASRDGTVGYLEFDNSTENKRTVIQKRVSVFGQQPAAPETARASEEVEAQITRRLSPTPSVTRYPSRNTSTRNDGMRLLSSGIGFSMTPRRENSMMNSIIDPSSIPPLAGQDSQEIDDNPATGRKSHNSSVALPDLNIQQPCKLYQTLLESWNKSRITDEQTTDRREVQLQFIRQPVTPGATSLMLKAINRLSFAVDEFINQNGSEGCVVIAHTEELNPILLVAFTITYSMAWKKYVDEDPIIALGKARKLIELNAQKRENMIAADCSAVSGSSVASVGSTTTASDSDVSDSLNVTHQLLGTVSKLRLADDKTDETKSEPLSPFTPIDILVKSELGITLRLSDSLDYVGEIFSHSNRHVEDSVATKLAVLYLECDQPLPTETLRSHSMSLARIIESYGLLLFYYSWLQSEFSSPFNTFIIETHPDAYCWLLSVNPFEGMVCAFIYLFFILKDSLVKLLFKKKIHKLFVNDDKKKQPTAGINSIKL